MDIDDIDRQILQVLEEDPRISNRKISDIVGLTPQAVGIRIKKLKDAGVIGGIKILKPLPKIAMDYKEVKRFQTKIPGFDNHLGGGFIDPSNILLIGEPGVGTTTFCLKILWSAMNAGLNCAYMGMERSSEQVIQQLRSFGWDPSQNENIQFIDVHNIIKESLGRFESAYNVDILGIYREMIRYHEGFWPKTKIIIIDSFTELLKLVRRTPVEEELISQLCTSMMKHRADILSIYVLKANFISEDSLLMLKSRADCVINIRKEVHDQQIRRYFLIEKMLSSEHTTAEIEFHITNEGIILEEYMLQHLALQSPPKNEDAAVFHVPELDYLTEGLPYGTTWILEIDSIFPLRDVVKLYANFFTDGIFRQETCLFAFPQVPLRFLLGLFEQSINHNKEIRKKDTTLKDLITNKQLILYDIFQKSLMFDNHTDLTYFEPISWSSMAEKNLEHFGIKLTEHKSDHTYLGFVISDLLDIPLDEEQIIQLYKSLKQIVQKREAILLTTINPLLHSESMVNTIRADADGIIKLWIGSHHKNLQKKYIQVIKTPQGAPSAPHLLMVHVEPTYFRVI